MMQRLDRGFLGGAVHPLGLAVGPGAAWLGEPVLDAVLIANAVEDAGAEVSPGWPVAVPWQVGKRHAVACRHGVDGPGECFGEVTEEVSPVRLSGAVAELDGANPARTELSNCPLIASRQNSTSSVIEIRQDSTRRLNQSSTAASWTKPRAVGIYVVSMAHTWLGRTVSTLRSSCGQILCLGAGLDM